MATDRPVLINRERLALDCVIDDLSEVGGARITIQCRVEGQFAATCIDL
jgi:hypothetical protein